MIVFSSGIVVTPAIASERWKPVILAENYITPSNIACDNEDADFPASNLSTPRTNSLWKAATLDVATHSIALSGQGYVDALGIARHNFGSGLVSVVVEGITGEPGAVYEVILEETLLGLDRPCLLMLKGDYYVGTNIILTPLGDSKPQAAVFKLGKAVQLRHGIQPPFVPPPYAKKRIRVGGDTEAGERLGGIVLRESIETSLSLSDVDPDWHRDTLQPVIDADSEFFISWAPTNYPEETAFMWIVNDPQPVISRESGQVDLTLQLRGLVL